MSQISVEAAPSTRTLIATALLDSDPSEGYGIRQLFVTNFELTPEEMDDLLALAHGFDGVNMLCVLPNIQRLSQGPKTILKIEFFDWVTPQAAAETVELFLADTQSWLNPRGSLEVHFSAKR